MEGLLPVHCAILKNYRYVESERLELFCLVVEDVLNQEPSGSEYLKSRWASCCACDMVTTRI